MSKNYEDYQPINPQPPRKRKNTALTFIRYSILFLLVLALAISAVLFVSTHTKEKNNLEDGNNTLDISTNEQTEPPQSDVVEDTTDAQTEPVEPPKPVIDLAAYSDIDVAKNMINKGGLIYVSGNYKVVYPTAAELVNLSNVKTKSYMLSINNMLACKEIVEPMNKMFDDFAAATGYKDVIIWTTYRDEARQKQVYDEYVKNNGEDAAKTAVSKPGESDHNTGLGIAIRVFRNGKSYQLSELEGYNWIQENCHKYGFVERYPNNKIQITGLDYSSSLYLRYVGAPHAEIMKKNDLCLEEYIVRIKEYAFGTVHYDYTTEEGIAYEFYYVSGQGEGDTVKVPVPKDKEYTISGNNMDGFIVTVKK